MMDGWKKYWSLYKKRIQNQPWKKRYHNSSGSKEALKKNQSEYGRPQNESGSSWIKEAGFISKDEYNII